MMPRTANFLALDGDDRIASIEAIFELIWANILVALVPPRRWRSRFGIIGSDDPPVGGNSADIVTVRRVRLAMARAVRHTPGNQLCLPQALAARRMLERRGIESRLFLGVDRDPRNAARFHAWLKVDDEWVTGICDEDRFAMLLPGMDWIA